MLLHQKYAFDLNILAEEVNIKECSLNIFLLTLASHILKLFKWSPCFSMVPSSHSLCSSCDPPSVASTHHTAPSCLQALSIQCSFYLWIPSPILPDTISTSHFTWLIITYSSGLLKNITSWRQWLSTLPQPFSLNKVRFSWYLFPWYLILLHGTLHPYNYLIITFTY